MSGPYLKELQGMTGESHSMPLRVTAQAKLPPIQETHSRFDPRDFATNSFVIVFFALVFFAPLVVLGAVAFKFVR